MADRQDLSIPLSISMDTSQLTPEQLQAMNEAYQKWASENAVPLSLSLADLATTPAPTAPPDLSRFTVSPTVGTQGQETPAATDADDAFTKLMQGFQNQQNQTTADDDINDLMKGAKGIPGTVHIPEFNIAHLPKDIAELGWNMGVGAAKGLGGTLWGLGSMAYTVPGLGQVLGREIPSVKQSEKPAWLEPEGWQQKLGYYPEQLAEFMVPAGDLVKGAEAAKALEVARSYFLTKAQGGGRVGADISAMLAAAVPGGGAAERALAAKAASKRWAEGAAENMVSALGANKAQKAAAVRVAPDLVKEGFGGSRQDMLATAEARLKDTTQKIDTTAQKLEASGVTLSRDQIVNNIHAISNKWKTPQPDGTVLIRKGYEKVVKQLDGFADNIAKEDSNITPTRALELKRDWDKIVAERGLYAKEAQGIKATRYPKEFSAKVAADQFRDLLNRHTTMKELNDAYVRYAPTVRILRSSVKADKGATKTLWDVVKGDPAAEWASAAVGTGIGLASGTIHGGLAGGWERAAGEGGLLALLGGTGLGVLGHLMETPYWQSTKSAPFKQMIANGLASKNGPMVLYGMRALISTLPRDAQAVYDEAMPALSGQIQRLESKEAPSKGEP